MKLKSHQRTKKFFTSLKFVIRMFASSVRRRFGPNIYDPPVGTPHPTGLDEPGEFPVKTFTAFLNNQEGRYSATVYYPEGTGAHPAVAFSPGLGAIRQWYQWIGEHLASHGYIVLIFTVPIPLIVDTIQQEAGFVTAFEYLERENEAPSSRLFGRVDDGRRAIMGHSLGAAAALVAAAKMDVDAVVSLAPAPVLDESLLDDIVAPTQIQVGSFDSLSGEETAASIYDLLTVTPRQFMTLNGANHLDFHDEGCVAYVSGNRFDHPATVDTTDHTQRLSCRYFTAWLDLFLKGNTSVERYLFGSDAQQDFASRQLAVLEFEQP